MNAKSYEVYRSVDGVNWTFITSQRAAGTSNTPMDYVGYDLSPVAGMNYYRLKMIDLDGSFKWSGIRWVTFSEETIVTRIRMYPNPATEYVSISGIADGRYVRVYDASGKLVINQSVNSSTKDIYVGKLASGMYEVVLIGKNGEKLLTDKLLKQ